MGGSAGSMVDESILDMPMDVEPLHLLYCKPLGITFRRAFIFLSKNIVEALYSSRI